MVQARYQFAGRCVTGSNPTEPNPSVAPNFSLRELARADKTYFIHPNLILTLQNIRNLLGQGITVVKVDEGDEGTRGFCATIASENPAELKRVCAEFGQAGNISKTNENDGRFFFEARTSPAESISLDEAMDVAFYVTTGYETSGDPFQQATGNFDGAGLSFGPSQVNFKTGTLVELFRRLEGFDADRLKQCFGADWSEWRSLWDKTAAQQIAWADSHSSGSNKANVAEPWRTHLKQVGQLAAFRTEIKNYSKDEYGKKLQRALQWLKTAWPQSITELRCLCALFDLCTQQGSLDSAHAQIRARIEAEKPTDQKQVVQIACEERAKTASLEWRANCMSRRLGILSDAPVSAAGSGNTAKVENPYFSLLPEMEVQDVEALVG